MSQLYYPHALLLYLFIHQSLLECILSSSVIVDYLLHPHRYQPLIQMSTMCLMLIHRLESNHLTMIRILISIFLISFIIRLLHEYGFDELILVHQH